jgi:hypothetical protein
MAKPSLIKLEFVHIPSEHFGAFWLFCEEHSGIQFKHQQPARSQALVLQGQRKHGKDKDGTSGKCIVLRTLDREGHPMTGPMIAHYLVQAGKAAKSFGGISMALVKQKLITVHRRGKNKKVQTYSITPAGSKFLSTSCSA